MKKIKVLVSGTVQGVNFRWATYYKALETGVAGWVRNTPDGKVEAVFQGDENQIQSMLDYVKQGPPAAIVSGVQTEELPVDDSLTSFEVRATH